MKFDLKAFALLPNALAFKTVTDSRVPMALSIGGRMTWEEIVKTYPKQYVALVDVYPDIYKLESAIVVHSEKDMSESDMFRGAMDGKWVVKGTSVDADFNMGTQFA